MLASAEAAGDWELPAAGAGLMGLVFAPDAAFGDRVIDHYVNSGRHEVQAFESAVTDWEMVRSFERS
jgi:glutamine synthetase